MTIRYRNRDVRAVAPVEELARYQAYVLWPVRLWRAHIQTDALDELDVFQRAVLGLVALGVTSHEELARTLHVSESLCVEVLRALRLRTLVRDDEPTDAALKLLERTAEPRTETRTAIEIEHTGTLFRARSLLKASPGLCELQRDRRGDFVRLLTAQGEAQFTYAIHGEAGLRADPARIEREFARRSERTLAVEHVQDVWLVTRASSSRHGHLECADPLDFDRASPELTRLLREHLDGGHAGPLRDRLLAATDVAPETLEAMRQARAAWGKKARATVSQRLGVVTVSASPERELVAAWARYFECAEGGATEQLGPAAVDVGTTIEAALTTWLAGATLTLSEASAIAVGPYNRRTLTDRLGEFAQRAEGRAARQLDVGQSPRKHSQTFQKRAGAARSLVLAALWAWGHDEAEWLNGVFGRPGTLQALLRVIQHRNEGAAHFVLEPRDSSLALDLDAVLQGLDATTHLIQHLRLELRARPDGTKEQQAPEQLALPQAGFARRAAPLGADDGDE